MTIRRRMVLSLALGSLMAFTLVSVAQATHPRPGSGSPFRVPLVNSYKKCASPNTTHVAPLAFPSCTPPVVSSTQLTTGNTGAAGGLSRLDVFCNGGAPGETPPCGTTAGDQEDINVFATQTDVRCQVLNALHGCPAVGADYTGSLIGQSDVRITDHANPTVCGTATGSGCTVATVQDIAFSVIVGPCVDNGGTNGANCTVSTTIDALVPNAVKELQRGVVSIFGIKALDAGPDGIVTGVSCPPTCGSGDEVTFIDQGIFIP
jgi:hypothetical protein